MDKSFTVTVTSSTARKFENLLLLLEELSVYGCTRKISFVWDGSKTDRLVIDEGGPSDVFRDLEVPESGTIEVTEDGFVNN